MKIRLDFVTNSSSSSFVAYSIHSKELADYIKSLVEQGKQEGGSLPQGLFSTESLGELQIFGDAKIVMVQEAIDGWISLNDCRRGDSRSLRQRVDDNLRLHRQELIYNCLKKFFRLDPDDQAHIRDLVQKAYLEDRTNCKTYMDATDSFTAFPLPAKNEFWTEGSTLVRHEIFQTHKTVEVPQGIKKIGYRAFERSVGSALELDAVILPEGVTEIGKQAFSDCRVKKVVLPSTLKYIRQGAFSCCKQLTEIHIPASVHTIESKAFENCAGLETVVMPGVTEIESEAFTGCAGLETVVMPGVMKIGSGAFAGCGRIKELQTESRILSVADDAFANSSVFAEAGPDGGFSFSFNQERLSGFTVSEKGVLIEYNGRDSVVNIPGHVTDIGQAAFQGSGTLTEVIIPDGVKTIGRFAFNRCKNLEKVFIPDSVTSIESYAFCECESLTELHIPDGLKKIGEEAFHGCKGLADENGFVIVKGRFYTDCSGSAVITIPDGVKEIDRRAFYGCEGLAEIRIPGSVKKIGEIAFEGCTGLTEVRIAGSVKKIGNGAFYGCTRLADENGLVIVQDKLYQYCSDGSQVTVPDGITEIDELAFSRCSSLTKIYLPDSLTKIGDFAFKFCENLTEVHIPDRVTNIGDSAFYGCTRLTKIHLPDSLTKIGSSAFSRCTSLAKIRIPKSVKKLGISVFYDCANLTIYGFAGSCAERHAAQHGIPFVAEE